MVYNMRVKCTPVYTVIDAQRVFRVCTILQIAVSIDYMLDLNLNLDVLNLVGL